MAYGEKYRLIFDSIFSKSKQNNSSSTTTVFKASIFQNGYTGSINDMVSNASPVLIETDRTSEIGYRPIIATKATFTMIVDSTFDVSQFLTCNGTDFYLLVKKGIRTDTYISGTYNSSTYSWDEDVYKGFYLPITEVSIPDISPYEFSLSFSDGFHFLKNDVYYQGTSEQFLGFRAADRITLHDLMTQCLSATNMDLPFATSFLFENADISHTGSRRQLESIYIYKNSLLKDAGSYFTYYEILEYIMVRFGMVCYQNNGKWYLMDYMELCNGSSDPRITSYNSSGVYQSTPTSVVFDTVTVNGDTFKQSGQSQLNRLGLPKKSITFKTDLKKFIRTGVRNDEFQAWSSSTVMYNWVTFGGGSIIEQFTLSTGRYAAKILGAASVTKYIKSNDITVKVGDTITIDWLQNYVYSGTNTDVAIFLQGDNAVSYFLQNDNTFSVAVNTFNAYDSITAGIDIALKIPVSGKLSARIYEGNGLGQDSYFDYFKLQVYGGSDSGTDPAGINNINALVEKSTSDASFTSGNIDYDNNFYNYDNTVMPYDYINTQQNAASNITSFISYMSDEYMNVLNDVWYYDNSEGANYLYLWVINNGSKNIMQNFIVIEGSFVTLLNPFNKYFSYTMISVGTKEYICIDFKWDLKQSEIDANLYSINLITTSPTTSPIKYLNYNT